MQQDESNLSSSSTTGQPVDLFGHLGDFQYLNQDVLTDIAGLWKDLARAAIEILPDFIARRKWPAKPVSADDQAELISLMNQWYGFKPKKSALSSNLSADVPTSNSVGS